MKEITDEQIIKLFPFAPRGKQLEIVKKIIEAYRNGKRHVILSLPTGGGKSVIAYAVSNLFKSAYVLTNQKILQEQYNKDLNVPYILGRANYICAENEQLTCEMGACKRQIANRCNNCPYLKAKDIAQKNWITNMNYAYFLRASKSKLFVPRPLLVLDESHIIETELIKAGTMRITEKVLHAFGIYDVNIPSVDATYYDKTNWLFNILLPRLREVYLYYKHQLQQFDKFKMSREAKKIIGKYSASERLVTVIAEIKSELQMHQKVIISGGDDFIEFKLLYGYNLFDKYFNSFADKFLHMSATILNKEQYCKKLNLDFEEVEYLEYESDFPIENRLIHYTPVGSLSWNKKAKTIPLLINKVKELLDKHKDEKGIIHTVNYELAEIISDGLYGTDAGSRLLIPRGTSRQTILDTFYTSNRPYVLISPSLTEGLDLKDDLSRFCIICKMPYANIADLWTKTRMKLDQTWYDNFTGEQLIQMSGRSIRSKTDFATTYILDSDFMRFAENNYKLLPDWWKAAVVEGE
jgi:Rad3-related DNA helicase